MTTQTTKTFGINRDFYDRREQRAIGHFISMVESKVNLKVPDETYKVMHLLQKEHSCYD